MQLSHTSQYAIRILSYIANQKDEKLQHAKDLSDTLSISYKFLTKIMGVLVKADFIISIRGREGGYKLARAASDITLLEIVNQFNELKEDNQCILGIGICDGIKKCSLHDQWLQPRELMMKMFAETTLESLEGSDFKI